MSNSQLNTQNSKLTVLTVIGARPQIIKAAAISRAIRTVYTNEIQEVIVHTGQHYDKNMSRIFFEELEIPKEDYNLNAGSGLHGKQTAIMMEGLEEIMIKEEPDYVIVYGDTNSTLAGAVAAAKLHIPVVHIEAGLRSFNKHMPEEINRITCDHASTMLFSPTETGFNNLIREGFSASQTMPFHIDNPGIYHCGDVMYDNSLYFAQIASTHSKVLIENSLRTEGYVLATIHRDSNTDDPDRLNTIFRTFLLLAEEYNERIILPLHPRTSKLLEQNLGDNVYNDIIRHPGIHIIPPVSFLDMLVLEKNASLIMTDSGGVQKEAYFFEKPCIILRSETEWVEIVKAGAAMVADADLHRILEAYTHFKNSHTLHFPAIFGDGKASEFICGEILKNHKLLS